jgi:hypothetical protein
MAKNSSWLLSDRAAQYKQSEFPDVRRFVKLIPRMYSPCHATGRKQILWDGHCNLGNESYKKLLLVMELSTSVSHNPRPCQLAGLPQRRAGRMVCRAFGKGARSDFRLSSATQGLPEPIRTEPVQPPNATAPLAVPVPLLAAGGLGLITVCAFLIKKLRGNSSEWVCNCSQSAQRVWPFVAP